MKNLKLSIALLSLLLIGVFLLNAQTMNHWEPWNVQTNYLRTTNLPAGTNTDSIVVKLANGWFGRVQAPAGFTVNTSITVGQTKAQLNTLYPNVPICHMVLCPNITLGGAIYIKATEAGSSDVWQVISAPPAL